MSSINLSLPLTEAARFLGISRQKMSRMVKHGLIPVHNDPLDFRKKIFRLSDLKRLKNAYVKAGIMSEQLENCEP